MTEADEFFEKTVQNVEEPVLMPVSETQECMVVEKEDDETFFDEEYADGVPMSQPRTKEEAIRRLKQAGQFRLWDALFGIQGKKRKYPKILGGFTESSYLCIGL